MAMLKLGEKIVSARVVILILSLVLLIPAAYGYIKTRVNYDILSYLPKDIETMEGQDILVDQFGTGAFSLYVVEGMEDKDVSALKSKIEKVDHVSKVIWYDSFADLSVPKDMLPESLYDAFNNDEKNATMMAIIFDDTTSADGTMDAIEEIRSISNKQCFLSGMSAVVVDTSTSSTCAARTIWMNPSRIRRAMSSMNMSKRNWQACWHSAISSSHVQEPMPSVSFSHSENRTSSFLCQRLHQEVIRFSTPSHLRRADTAMSSRRKS